MTTILYSELQNNLEIIKQKLVSEPITVLFENGDKMILLSLENFEAVKDSLPKSKSTQKSKSPRKRKRRRLEDLTPHHGIIGDPAELVDLKVFEWTEEKNF